MRSSRTAEPTVSLRRRGAGFTLIEVMMALGVIGIGLATTVGVLTHVNTMASTARNATGAYTVLMNAVDTFQSMSPFNPQKINIKDGTPQIPKDTAHGSFPQYDMTVTAAGSNRKLSLDGVTWNVPVYEYRDNSNNVVVVVNGTLTETVQDLSSATPPLPNTYQATFTLTYTFRNKSYSYSMTTVRTSDI